MENLPAHPEPCSHPRYEVDAAVTLALVNHGANLTGRLFEISLGSCGVRLDRAYPLPSPVRIEVIFKINGIAFRIGGTLQWTDKQCCAGVRFAPMAPRRLEALTELLEELEAEQAAKAAKAAREEAESLAAAQLIAEQSPAAEDATAPMPEPGNAAAPVNAAPAPHNPAPHNSNVRPLQLPSVPLPGPRIPPTAPIADPLRTASAASVRLPLPPSAASILPVAKPAPRVEFSHPPRIELVGLPKAEARPAPAPPPQPAKPPRVPGRERRAQSRHAVDTHAVIYLIDVAARVPGRILDLSMSGCRIRAEERFPVGIYRRVETEFKLDGLPFRLAGVVQSLHDKFNVGIRFLDMSPRKRDQLNQLMEEIEEMRRNPPANPEAVEVIPVVSPHMQEPAKS